MGYGGYYTSCVVNSAGNLAYVSSSRAIFGLGGYSAEMQIINITIPANPTLIWKFDAGTPSNPFLASKIVINGNVAYWAGSSLLIFNVTDSTNPSLIGSYDSKALIYDIKINGNLAYLANSGLGLQIIDISDPRNPRLVQSYYTLDVNSIIISNNIVYTVGKNGLVLINKAFPDTTLMKLEYQAASQVADVFAENNGLFTLYSAFGLTWLDATNTVTTIELPLPNPVTIITSLNNIAYAGVNSTIEIIDLTNSTYPTLLASFSTSGSINDICISNGIAYIAGSTGLELVDVSNPTNPKYLGIYKTAYEATSVSVSNNFVYLIDGNLDIININNLTNPQLLASYSLLSSVTSISFNKNCIFLTDSTGILQTIDVSDPATPQFLTSFQYLTPSFGQIDINYVSVRNNIAYLAVGNIFAIVDISNPANPTLLSSYSPPHPSGFYQLNLVSLSDSIAMVTDSLNNLNLIDVSNPLQPQLLESYVLPAGVNSIAFDGKTGLVGDNLGLRVIAPTPLWSSRLALKELPLMLTSANNYTYIVDNSNVLHIIDSHIKSNLAEVSANYQLLSTAQSLMIKDDFLYISELNAQLVSVVQIVDIYNSTLPKLATQIMNNVSISNVLTLFGTQLFVADSTDGLLIYDILGQPLLVNYQFAIIPGIQFIVTNDQISARDTNVGADPLLLTFSISNLQNGKFQLLSQPNISITSFTQRDIFSGNVIFIPSSSGLLPSFQITVSNGLQTTAPQNVSVVFSGNIPPQIVNNSLTINQDETVTLTSSDLGAVDINLGRQLTFVTNQIKNGRFQVVTAPGIFITTFTPQDIALGRIQFVATGGGTDIPGYQVTVDDGVLTSPVSTAIINYDAAPQIITNQLTITKGATVTLTRSNLEATDVDSNATSLFFTISGVQYGSFNQLNFTQQALFSGLIQFTQDGSDQTPNYYVNVSDGRVQVGPEKAVTNLSNNLTGIIAGATTGGAVLLAGAIGAGFWFRKRNQDYNTRKQYRFADHIREALKLQGIDNFKSEKGRRYLSVIQKLENEFSTKGGMTLSGMGDKELKDLAQQVAISARNKITPSTRCGYSIINPEDIDDSKISSIVQDVLRMRVGQDDANIPMSSL